MVGKGWLTYPIHDEYYKYLTFSMTKEFKLSYEGTYAIMFIYDEKENDVGIQKT